MRRLTLPLSALLASSVLLAGCGGSDSHHPAAPSPTEGTKVSTPQHPQTWPLTGLRVPNGKSPQLTHPVLVTKMDNTTSSAPQMGLNHADMVVEELVEGGLTRLAAFFYSDVPPLAGPVRSMRASDIDIVSPVAASVVTSGAAGRTITRIKGAGIPFYGEGAKGFYRDNGRLAPYNLLVKLKELAASVKKKAVTVPNYFNFGTDKDVPKGAKATSIHATFSGGHTTEWKYAGGKYTNLNSNAPTSGQFPASSVLVLRVKEGDAGYLDPAGNHVPETLFTGQGKMWLFHHGQVVQGFWHKGKAGSRVTLTARGKDLKVPAGHTWVELVPIAGHVGFTK